MRKIIYLIVSLMLLLLVAACGSETVPATAVPIQPTEAPASEPVEPETVNTETQTEAEPETQTVVAKPQLIEFYAHW